LERVLEPVIVGLRHAEESYVYTIQVVIARATDGVDAKQLWL
jgi:hypothetical protein